MLETMKVVVLHRMGVVPMKQEFVTLMTLGKGHEVPATARMPPAYLLAWYYILLDPQHGTIGIPSKVILQSSDKQINQRLTRATLGKSLDGFLAELFRA